MPYTPKQRNYDIKGGTFKNDLEEAIQSCADGEDIVVNLHVGNINSNENVFKRLKDSIGKGVTEAQTKTEGIISYKMSKETARLVKSNGRGDIGTKTNDLGRYFEQIVFYELMVQLQNLGADVSFEAEKGFYQDTSLSATDQAMVEKCAAESVSLYIKKHFKTSQKGGKIKVIGSGGSNTLGDIKIEIGGSLSPLVIELKFYEKGGAIKYFELSDKKNFGLSFVEYLKSTSNPDLWRTNDPLPVLEDKDWVTRVRTTGFEGYMEALKKDKTSAAYLRWLLQKGQAQADFGLKDKSIIVGTSATDKGPIVKISLQSMINSAAQKTLKSFTEGDKYLFTIGKENPETIAQLTTDKQQIESRSLDHMRRKLKNGKDWQWTTTTFIFHLQKAFFNLGL